MPPPVTDPDAPPTPNCVAIDGPSASGKSTIGRMLAQHWDLRLLDTGTMYRCVTKLALDKGIDLADEAELGAVAWALEFDLQRANDGSSQLRLHCGPLPEGLTSEEITNAVSAVSAVGAVREAMVDQQRQIASAGSIVMMGRDIGTVVLPDADFKVYLDASVRERAVRRFDGKDDIRRESLEAVMAAIERRDHIDSSRDHSPLRRADDAFYVNSDGLEAHEAFAKILDAYRVRQRTPA